MNKTIKTVPFGYAKNEVESVFALLTSKIAILEGDIKYLKEQNERLNEELALLSKGQPYKNEILNRSELLLARGKLKH